MSFLLNRRLSAPHCTCCADEAVAEDIRHAQDRYEDVLDRHAQEILRIENARK